MNVSAEENGMRRIGFAAMALCHAAVPVALQDAPEGGNIVWRDGKEHDQALAEAKATGMPVVLFFTAVW